MIYSINYIVYVAYDILSVPKGLRAGLPPKIWLPSKGKFGRYQCKILFIILFSIEYIVDYVINRMYHALRRLCNQ
jgi:hypothetical protein